MLFRSLLHSFPSTLTCALSQSVSPSPTPLTLSSAPSPSRRLPPPFIPFHSQVRSLSVGVFLRHSFPSALKCALSQSVSPIPTPLALSCALSPSRCLSPPHHSHSQVRSLLVGVSLLHTIPTLSIALSPSRCLPHLHYSYPIKCALSQSASPSSTHSRPLSSALSL